MCINRVLKFSDDFVFFAWKKGGIRDYIKLNGLRKKFGLDIYKHTANFEDAVKWKKISMSNTDSHQLMTTRTYDQFDFIIIHTLQNSGKKQAIFFGIISTHILAY